MTAYCQNRDALDRRVGIPVKLGARSYEIRIGDGLIDQVGRDILPFLNRPQVAIVTDQTVAKLHLRRLTAALNGAGIASVSLILPSGETTKSWDLLIRVTDWLLEMKIERNDVVVAFGGGVIGDLTGLAASILRRGTRLIQIPTTLLAQVDSSVGGKTAINTIHGKNLVGSFHQPELVLADTGVLRTLPKRELLSGYGEVLKYALLGDSDFFAWLEEHGVGTVNGEEAALRHAIQRAVEIKSAIVGEDEKELGQRALLNLGHTFSHALEKATGYSDELLHGEGVSIGCLLAFDLACHLGRCSYHDKERLRQHLVCMGLRTAISDLACPLPSPDDLIKFIQQDKKTVAGRLCLVLPERIGRCILTDDVPHDILKLVLAQSASSCLLH